MPTWSAAASGLIAVALLVAGCAGGDRLAPVSRVDPVAHTKPDTHIVRKGDTLYAIAWEHDLDYRMLAAWNRLEHPFVIYPGQELKLQGTPLANVDNGAQAEVSTAALPEPPKIDHRKIDEGRVDSGAASRSSSDPDNAVSAVSPAKSGAGKQVEERGATQPDIFDGEAAVKTWHWPTKGKVIGAFGKSGDKGIHLSGTYEQPIVAAADGRVVYSGTGLVGYGRLIVIKHNKRFFSAYAHNSRILVEEGEIVDGGQRIALMGSSGSDRVKLHFEIRRNGKPVDPSSYLPG